MKKEISKSTKSTAGETMSDSLVLKLILVAVVVGFGALIFYINVYVNKIASIRAELSQVMAPLVTVPEKSMTPPPVNPTAGIANPASTNCIAKAGNLKIETKPDGSQYGVCYFEDNYQCEEWAMLRGDCPVGGLRVTGYITPAATFCAISGGSYTMTKEAPAVAPEKEEGICSFKNGQKCDVWKFYDGSCSANKAE